MNGIDLENVHMYTHIKLYKHTHFIIFIRGLYSTEKKDRKTTSIHGLLS